MKLNHYLSLLLGLLVLGTTFSSCSDDNPVPSDDDYDMTQDPAYDPDYVFPTGEHGIVYTSPTFVSSGVSNDLKEAFSLCLSQQVASVDASTQLIVLTDFSEVNDQNLIEAFSYGATIALVEPKASAIESFIASHPDLELTFSETDIPEGTIIYYFDNENCSGVVIDQPLTVTLEDETLEDYDDEEEEISTGEDNYNDYYTIVGSWLQHLIADEEVVLRAGSSSGLPSVEDLAVNHHYSITFPIKHDHVVRKCFSIVGTGAVTVSYDIHQLHIYNDGKGGGGNYYLVSMATSAANEDMYKGMASTWKWKYFCVTHRIGYICTDFTVQSTLTQKDGKTPVSNIIFPASGSPIPETTVGATTYTSGTEFSIGADGGWSQEEGWNWAVNMGASWSSSQSRAISDIDIQNLTTGNQPKWKVNYNNIPYYSDECKFKEHNGVTAFKSTQYLYSQWVWYEPDAADDAEQEDRYIRVDGSINHKAMSFFTTRADLDTKNYKTEFNHSFALDKIYNKKKAGIIFRNTTDSYINNIQIINKENNAVVYTYPNGCVTGDEFVIGWFEVKGKNYTMQYDMGGSTYSYNINNGVLPLSNATSTDHTITVHAKEEFVKK